MLRNDRKFYVDNVQYILAKLNPNCVERPLSQFNPSLKMVNVCVVPFAFAPFATNFFSSPWICAGSGAMFPSVNEFGLASSQFSPASGKFFLQKCHSPFAVFVRHCIFFIKKLSFLHFLPLLCTFALSHTAIPAVVTLFSYLWCCRLCRNDRRTPPPSSGRKRSGREVKTTH
jgi:hypothetical protein